MKPFKNLKLTKADQLWLTAIYENDCIPDPATFKVRLHEKLPKGFRYENLHRTFIWDNRLNMLGIWVINPNDKIFGYLDKTIKAIKSEIEKTPKLDSITAEKIAKLTKISIEDAKEALGYLGHHGSFWSTARGVGGEFGQEVIGFSGVEHIDLYLNYKDIPTLLGEMWEKFRLDLYLYPPKENSLEEGKTQLCYSKFCNVVVFGTVKWAFHANAAKVVRILFEVYLKKLPEIHIGEIRSYLPEKIKSDPLNQIFKSHKGKPWRELVIAGPSGKGFWQLNPKYLENGVKEIDLGLSLGNTAENS